MTTLLVWQTHSSFTYTFSLLFFFLILNFCRIVTSFNTLLLQLLKRMLFRSMYDLVKEPIDTKQNYYVNGVAAGPHVEWNNAAL